MALLTLNQELEKYKNKLIDKSKKKNRLPATIIGCEYRNKRKVDKSGSVPNPLQNYLKAELVKIGPIGSKANDNFIGCCCEVRSSNQILVELKKQAKLTSITFTEAVRPRTGQIIDRCENCKLVYGK